MKFPIAVPFKLHFPQMDNVSEFNIKYTPDKNSFEKLIEFIKTYDADYRINIEFPQDIDMSVIKSVNSISDNVYIRVTRNILYHLDKIVNTECKFFMDATLPVSSLIVLHDMIKLGVTDVYIADDLCYNLDEVSEYCHENNVGLRCVLNLIPSTSLNKGTDPKSMFYRPQDITFLMERYDCFEFDCGDPFDQYVFNSLYRAWFVQSWWDGNLKEINKDLKIDIPNNALLEAFTFYKSTCKLRCIKSNAHCHKCELTLKLANTLKEKKLRIKYDSKIKDSNG